MPHEKTNDIRRALSGSAFVVVLDRGDENLLPAGEKRHGVNHCTSCLVCGFPAHEDVVGSHRLMTFIWKQDGTAG